MTQEQAIEHARIAHELADERRRHSDATEVLERRLRELAAGTPASVPTLPPPPRDKTYPAFAWSTGSP